MTIINPLWFAFESTGETTATWRDPEADAAFVKFADVVLDASTRTNEKVEVDTREIV